MIRPIADRYGRAGVAFEELALVGAWRTVHDIRVLGMTNEKFRGLKAEDLVDDRIVRKLEKEGAF
jgi:hypothetical protein